MNRFSRAIVLGSGVFVFGLAAHGQTSDRYYPQRDDPYYRNDRGYSDRQGYGSRDPLIGRVLSDINRAASNARLDGHEFKHVEEASNKLQEFEARWADGNFDNGKLDKAIENIQHLAEADRVRGRDRDMLARDLDDLRRFRSTRGRFPTDGYGDSRYERYRR